ncbi:MAG: dihydrofolate synthase / folylpolyglutamate synthase [Actinomycetota bacterium]|jgi:dihydrofolate synthase/folylpolyglutamate synthase|nr:dihydrofolate synthase / folylpolyglutamate synthase [Actinomycetota bacterium]
MTAATESTAAYLDSLTSYERTGVLASPTLERITALLSALGDPHRCFRSIHVTGTNGKGSVTVMTAALLAEHGLSVGTYTSPHLDRLGERVTVQGRPADEEAMDLAVGAVRNAAISLGITPTWFEVVTAAAFWLLAEHRVDVAVVEVGMLGRWDATNVIHGDVAVVTNVELDHTDLAGPTRADVAREKAGIVEPGATLVLGDGDPDLRPIFEAAAPARIVVVGEVLAWSGRRTTATGSVVDLRTARGEHRAVRVGMPGSHQCSNALLAVAAVEAFLDTTIATSVVDRSLARVSVPGRCEIAYRAPLVVLDGAHNPAGLAALRDTIAELRTPSRAVLVCGVLGGRDLVPALHTLAADFDVVIASEPVSPRAIPAAALAAALRERGRTVVVVPDPVRAVEAAVAAAGREGTVLVTGSLHLLSAARSGLPTVEMP